VNISKIGLSAVTRLATVAALAGAFLFGMAAVVYMSLQGKVVQVPEIVGKNFADSEKELAALGLKIKRRAERPSGDAPNTVLEQLPKPGETVKTGQLIFVITSQPTSQSDQAPSTLRKSLEEDDTEKIEEMISDKPKKKATNSNSNSAKKKPDTTRDVIANSAANSDSTDSAAAESNKKKDASEGGKGDKGREVSSPESKQQAPPPLAKPSPPKPSSDRPRTVSRP